MTVARAGTSESGFTLIELMVSIVLLGLLTTALFAGVSFGVRAWKQANAANFRLAEIIRAQIALTDLLSGAYPHIIAADRGNHVDFEGSATSISFLAPATADIAPGGFERITLRLDQGETGLALSYAAQPELSITSYSLRKVLLNGVQNLAFSFYGPDEDGGPAQWFSTWHDRLRLPMLIRIQASLTGSRSAQWPDLTIRPRVAADASCSFDPLTKYCRGY